MRSICYLCLGLLALLALPARAHKPSDSYLRLSTDATGFSGRWDIALRDLDADDFVAQATA